MQTCTKCKLMQIVKCEILVVCFVCNTALFIAASEFTRTCLWEGWSQAVMCFRCGRKINIGWFKFSLNYVILHILKFFFNSNLSILNKINSWQFNSMINVQIRTHFKNCFLIVVQINKNVAHERPGHKLWPGFCSN